jgi:hypothetical protein
MSKITDSSSDNKLVQMTRKSLKEITLECDHVYDLYEDIKERYDMCSKKNIMAEKTLSHLSIQNKQLVTELNGIKSYNPADKNILKKRISVDELDKKISKKNDDSEELRLYEERMNSLCNTMSQYINTQFSLEKDNSKKLKK